MSSMQERRTRIRIRHQAGVQYCSSDNLSPRDGKLRDLSDRGAGLLTREAHRCGDTVTIGFLLPGDKTTWTATGVIRWVDRPAGRWYPVGLDWYQLEDTTRNRLHRFLETRTPAAGSAAPAAKPAAQPAKRLAFWSAFSAFVLVAVVAGYAWVRALQWENRQLATGIEQRDGVIVQLQQEENRLTLELEDTRTQLAETAKEIEALDAQAQGFGHEVNRLTEQVDEFQNSYMKLQEERQQLMQRVLDLEQEKLALNKRLQAMDELRMAVREAIDARKTAPGLQRESIIKAQRDLDQKLLSAGNQGYLVKDGRPAGNEPGGMRVKVLEPAEADSAPAPEPAP